MADGISFGEASFISGSEFGNSEDQDALMSARIRHFSRSVLSAEAWFRTADELIAAMSLVERNVERFWQNFNSILVAVDATVDPPKHYRKQVPQESNSGESPPKYDLINQHMMLAGFAIENLCKGYLVRLLTPKEKKEIEKGQLPKKLNSHNLVELARLIGMSLSNREKDLLERIEIAAVWRGRYPSPTRHEKVRPFAQWENDIERIRMFLPRLRGHVRIKS